MTTVKHIANVKYVIYQWKSVKKWGWSKGIYLVHPDAEQEFIQYILGNIRDNP